MDEKQVVTVAQVGTMLSDMVPGSDEMANLLNDAEAQGERKTKTQDTLDKVESLAEELQAILLLEYHNKNHLRLGTNPKKLNEEKREIVSAILAEVKRERATEN